MSISTAKREFAAPTLVLKKNRVLELDTDAFYQQVASEVSRISYLSDKLIQIDNAMANNEAALSFIGCQTKSRLNSLSELKVNPINTIEKITILLNGTLNYSLDIQGLLLDIHSKINRFSRVVAVTYNPYYRGLFSFLARIGITRSRQIQTFITRDSLRNLCQLSHFQIVKVRPVGLFPIPGHEL